MSYVLGALHDLLSGSGSVTVAAPAGLLIAVLAVPLGVGLEPGTPTRLHRFGHITPGDANGWFPSVQIIKHQQHVLPIPEGVQFVGYDMVPGAGISIRELEAGPLPNFEKQPWDRNPTSWRMANAGSYAGGTASAAGFTYTVPANRKLLVVQASVICARATPATVAAGASGTIYLDGQSILRAQFYGNVLGDESRHELAAGPLLLNAGQTISSTYLNGDTGGAVSIEQRVSGYTFDA